MKTKELQVPDLTEQAVYEAIAYHPDSISRDSLARLFELSTDTIGHLDATINKLVRAKKIYRAADNVSRYAATTPMSDLVVARITNTGERNRIELTIENNHFELEVPVTMPAKQARAHRLKYGEKVLAILERHKGFELRAKFFDRVSRDNPPSLVGKFSNKSEPDKLVPLDRRIKTTFAIAAAPGVLDPRTPYYARISPAFDPHKPELVLGEQKWDPKTGNRIYEVIASNFGILTRHDRPSTLEAKRISSKIRRITPDDYIRMGRRDLSHIPFKVADPKGAQDHDDAVHVERLPHGFWSITAVADVAMFVRSGSELDTAARNRGFSHYLPDETFHMLPLHLSTNACSLLEGKLRPVTYVEQFRDLDGIPYETNIGLGYIRSQQQMTYEQFQHFIGTNEGAAYRELQRILNIRQYENEIMMESASTDHRYTEAQLIVQAMMIDAGKATAAFLEERKIPTLYRTHSGDIDPIAYAEQVDSFAALDYELPENIEDLTPSFINGIINQAAMRGDKEKISSKIRLELLRPALYDTRPIGHFGITARVHCHATSPIRRYSDIIVQRGIHTAIGDDEYGLSENDINQMEQTARILNRLQTINRNVQHDTTRYYAVKDLHRQEGNSMHAHLSRINREQIEITLPAYGLKKTLPLTALPPGWQIAANGRGITDRNVYIAEGSRVRVTITDVQPHRAQWGVSRLEAVKGNYELESTRKKPRIATRNGAHVPAVA